MKKKWILFIIVLSSLSSLKSQDLGELLQVGVGNTEGYLERYANPLMGSFTNGLGSGWYNTAKPHKLLGVDLTATVSLAAIPSGERLFIFNTSDFQNLALEGSSDNTLPTAVGGPAEEGAELVIPAGLSIDVGNGESITYATEQRFSVPDGADLERMPVLQGVPVPAVQFGIGLPKNTDLKFRFVSDFGNLEDGSITLFGIGIMHDIKQWIPGFKPVQFDASAFVGYTSFSSSIDYEVDNNAFLADGSVGLSGSSFTLQAVVSKKLSVITPYIGIGFILGSSSLDINGNYTYQDASTGIPLTITDPISIAFDSSSSPKINAGLRLKLLVLTFHAEYALQKYNTLTFGVGISVR